MLKQASAAIALLALSNPALAAADCANPTEAAALKTAVLQQELMVAAFQCHEAGAYNRFVNTFRPELQSSDASLKAFFVRRGGEHGEAGYDAFKTRAANLSALENARNATAFCADAHALFQAAMSHRGSLMSFVNARAGGADVGKICSDSRPAPVLAEADMKPPPGMARQIKPATAGLKAAPQADPVKAGASPAQVAVAGVPTYNVPAIPWSGQATASAGDLAGRDAILRDRQAARQEQLEDDAAEPYDEEEAAAPPPPRYYRARMRRDDDPYAYGYGERAYPPAWQYQDRYPLPPPRGWYRRDDW